MATGADQAIEAPRILLTGASSQIGVFAIPRLLAAGFSVLAVSRKGRPDGFPELDKVEWLIHADTAMQAPGCGYLLSAGPMDTAKSFLENNPLIKTAVVFSSSSVETKLESANAAEREQMKDMLKLESELINLAVERGASLVIFRPTLIYGCGLDTNISRLAAWIRRFGFMPLNGVGKGLRQPVHADDLASVAVVALLSKRTLPGILTVTGGESLTYAEMVRRIFSALGKPARLVLLPEWSFLSLARLMRVFNAAKGITDEMIKRQNVDLVFDDRQVRDLFDFKPRQFFPTEADFSLPDLESLKKSTQDAG